MAPALEKIALFAGIAAVAVTVNVNLPLHLDHVDTPSMKMGWYWVTPGATVHRGDVVTACPSSRYARWAYAVRILGAGPCDGIERITKRVVAVAGDRVRIDAGGVFVNGQYQADSKPRPIYQGKPVPHVPFGDRVLGPGEVELLGDRRSGSWDGRFFGPTDRVLGRATLMLPTGG